MKITHDREADVVRITLSSREAKTTGKMFGDVILHVDENNKVLAVEILGASTHIMFEYQDVTHPRYDQWLEHKEEGYAYPKAET